MAAGYGNDVSDVTTPHIYERVRDCSMLRRMIDDRISEYRIHELQWRHWCHWHNTPPCWAINAETWPLFLPRLYADHLFRLVYNSTHKHTQVCDVAAKQLTSMAAFIVADRMSSLSPHCHLEQNVGGYAEMSQKVIRRSALCVSMSVKSSLHRVALTSNFRPGRKAMTTESSKNGAITLFHMNFSGYVGHATIIMLFSSMVRIMIRFSVWLVNGYAHVFYTTFRCHCHPHFRLES